MKRLFIFIVWILFFIGCTSKPDIIVYGYDQKEFLNPKGVEIVKLSKKIDDSKFKTGRIIDELGL